MGGQSSGDRYVQGMCSMELVKSLYFQVSQSSLTMLSSPSPGQQVQTPQSMPPPPQPSPQPGSQPNSNVR